MNETNVLQVKVWQHNFASPNSSVLNLRPSKFVISCVKFTDNMLFNFWAHQCWNFVNWGYRLVKMSNLAPKYWIFGYLDHAYKFGWCLVKELHTYILTIVYSINTYHNWQLLIQVSLFANVLFCWKTKNKHSIHSCLQKLYFVNASTLLKIRFCLAIIATFIVGQLRGWSNQVKIFTMVFY